MPPTIQNEVAEKRPVREGERRSDLICRVKYSNTLPDIPFDLKFITYPFESTRFIQYNPTSLERNYRYEVLTEHDLGVNIDLISMDLYTGDGGQLDPADEKLLEEDILTPQDSKRSRHHAKSVSWLRRSEYISTEQTRFQPQTMEKVEAKVGYNVKKSLGEETLYMDRESQMKAIDKTFEDAKITIDKHYSKPGVVPVEVMPVFPDFMTWRYPCAQVIFDSDPAPQDKPIPAQIEQMSQAMIRGVMDESGEQFVAYFLPTDETLTQRKLDVLEGIPYNDEENYEYKMAREYNWNVKSKASKGYEENYFFVVREGAVYYNELETRVRLSKRRQRAGLGPGGPGGTRLVVRHRPLALQEHRMQRLRERQLEPPQEDEEEEVEDEDEPMDTAETQRNSRSKSRSRSRSPAGSKTAGSPRGSRENSGSRRGSGSEAGSRASSRAKSGSRSRSGSRKGSRNGSRASSKSRSRSRSGSGSRAASGSRASSRRSGSGSRSRSVSRSKSRSRSRSKSKSRSRSKSGSRSRSRSRSKSKSRSGSERSRSRSGSGSRQGSQRGSRSGSASSRSSAKSGSGSE